MARKQIRYLITQPGPAGGLPRHFWQPTAKLRAAGFATQRVPLNWQVFTDAAGLEAAAIARAQDLNAELDAWRESRALASVAPPPPPGSRTLHDLIVLYKQDKAFTTLAPATQRGYGQCIAKLETWGGDAPLRVIDARRVQALKDALESTPAFANAVVRVLRLLLEFGRRQSWITVNPAMRPGLAGTEPSGLIWPAAAIGVFVAAADRMGLHSIGTAVMLNDWLGQREADVLQMTRSVLRNGTLWVRQSKTGAGVALPVGMVAHLVQRLEEEAARVTARLKPGAPTPATILVCEATGLPWKPDNFRHQFAAVRAEAAKAQPCFEIDHLMPGRDMASPDCFKVRMEELTFMQLRHTAVTRLAEAECDPGLISTISGHSLATVNQILERYMVRTGKMARLAFGRRQAAEGLAPERPRETGSTSAGGGK
jgi:integrase